jgi:hypothetical protein
MATVKFNTILIDVAQRLKSPRAYATDNVDVNGNTSTYSSSMLAKHINRAIRDLLLDKYNTLGEIGFAEMFPEYIKTSGALTLAAGLAAKPVDAFIVTGLRLSDDTVKFDRIKPVMVEDIKTSREKQIIPSATRPVFWDEHGSINTLGLLSGSVIMRYIITHEDIVPVSSVATTGKWNTSNDGAFTFATRLLAGTMSTVFSALDVNKRVMFRTSANTYAGRIESYVSASSVVVIGDNLPSGNIVAGNVLQIIVSDVEPDSSDLKINNNFFAEIINRAVQYALADAKNGVMQ